MYFPIRCFTCGKVIGHLYEKYTNEVKSGKEAAQVLNLLGVKRVCCRRMFLTHVDVSDVITKYKKF